MDRIAAFLNERQPRHAVVIGGGFIGLEMAEAFHHRGLHVTIVERNPHILPLLDRDMAAHLQNQIRRDDFDFKTSAEATRFTDDGVEFADGSRLPADLILMSVGVKAEVELARAAGLEIGETGGVKTNGRLESSDPNIYAVGDAAETMHALTGARARIALAGPANRQGRIAGANAAGARLIYPGALGTSIVRVLNMTAGFTGLNSAQAKKAGFTFFTSLTRDNSHAHYYPGAKPVLIKIVAEEGTGRLLGAQVLGECGVDKRVDVLATAITGKMSVFDLETLDFGLFASVRFGERSREHRWIRGQPYRAGRPCHHCAGELATRRRISAGRSRPGRSGGIWQTQKRGEHPSGATARPAGGIAARPPHRDLLPERATRLSGRVRPPRARV